MKRLVLVVMLMAVLVGCASWKLPGDATTEQRVAALCTDAQMGFALSQAVLSQFVSAPEVQTYWEAYKRGTEVALVTYCVGG